MIPALASEAYARKGDHSFSLTEPSRVHNTGVVGSEAPSPNPRRTSVRKRHNTTQAIGMQCAGEKARYRTAQCIHCAISHSCIPLLRKATCGVAPASSSLVPRVCCANYLGDPYGVTCTTERYVRQAYRRGAVKRNSVTEHMFAEEYIEVTRCRRKAVVGMSEPEGELFPGLLMECYVGACSHLCDLKWERWRRTETEWVCECISKHRILGKCVWLAL
jgi:hypothetical protein